MGTRAGRRARHNLGMTIAPLKPPPNAISAYGVHMPAKKVTITLPEEMVAALAATARAEGVPMSQLVASAAEVELRRRLGRQFIADFEAEHGPFTAEELASARAEMAAADLEALQMLQADRPAAP